MQRGSQDSEMILMADEDERECVGFYDEDEKGSISSESTCYGGYDDMKSDFQPEQKPFTLSNQSDIKIWRSFQVSDQNMQDIPNADKILEDLSSKNVESEPIRSNRYCHTPFLPNLFIIIY